MRGSKSITIGSIIVALVVLPFSSSYSTEKKQPPKTVPEKTIAKPYHKITPAKPLPDLVVENIWLDKEGYINFQLKNAGTGKIPDAEHRQGMVRVSYGKRYVDFFFQKTVKEKLPVDPTGALKQPGTSVTYNTKIRLKARQTITVRVDSTAKITESNEKNNFLAQRPTEKLMAVKPDSKVKPDSTLSDMKLKAKPIDLEGATPTGEVVLKKIDYEGINITLPREGQVFTPHASLSIRFRYLWDIPMRITDINLCRVMESEPIACVSLYDAFHWLPGEGPMVEPGETMNIDYWAPRVEGTYFYTVRIGEYDSGYAYGTSDNFFVREPGSPTTLEVFEPGAGGEHWGINSDHTIRWSFSPGSDGRIPTDWEISLLRLDPDSYRYYTIGSITPTRTPTRSCGAGYRCEYTTTWSIPWDTPAGDYKIRVSGGGISAESGLMFTIGNRWELYIDRIYTNPVTGHLMADVSNLHHVSGRVDFRVELMDRGSVMETWELIRSLAGGTDRESVDLGRLGPLNEPPPPGFFESHCGLTFRVTVDSTDRIDEPNETNNRETGEAHYRGDHTKVWICGGTPYEGTHSPDCTIVVQNCGTDSTTGQYEVWQIGDWPVGGELLSSHHENLIEVVDIYLTQGESHTFYYRNADGYIRYPHTFEVRFSGFIERWVTHNPYRVNLRP
jgi:hypothetical protein